jgi:hypothetical protein
MSKSGRARQLYSGVYGLYDYDDGEVGEGMTSPRSPTNLKYARSHAELAGRKDPPLSAGVSMREPLETEDYTNWE